MCIVGFCFGVLESPTQHSKAFRFVTQFHMGNSETALAIKRRFSLLHTQWQCRICDRGVQLHALLRQSQEWIEVQVNFLLCKCNPVQLRQVEFVNFRLANIQDLLTLRPDTNRVPTVLFLTNSPNSKTLLLNTRTETPTIVITNLLTIDGSFFARATINLVATRNKNQKANPKSI